MISLKVSVVNFREHAKKILTKQISKLDGKFFPNLDHCLEEEESSKCTKHTGGITQTSLVNGLNLGVSLVCVV